MRDDKKTPPPSPKDAKDTKPQETRPAPDVKPDKITMIKVQESEDPPSRGERHIIKGVED